MCSVLGSGFSRSFLVVIMTAKQALAQPGSPAAFCFNTQLSQRYPKMSRRLFGFVGKKRCLVAIFLNKGLLKDCFRVFYPPCGLSKPPVGVEFMPVIYTA